MIKNKLLKKSLLLVVVTLLFLLVDGWFLFFISVRSNRPNCNDSTKYNQRFYFQSPKQSLLSSKNLCMQVETLKLPDLWFSVSLMAQGRNNINLHRSFHVFSTVIIDPFLSKRINQIKMRPWQLNMKPFQFPVCILCLHTWSLC